MIPRALARGVLAANLLGPAAAVAQPATEQSPSAGSADTLADIIVTSTKRSEDVRKVPLSISVVTADDVQEQHIRDLTDLTRAVPNLSFSGAAGQGPGLNSIEIRGISSQAGQSTVGVYLDDVALNTRNLGVAGEAEPKFFDISRVEVLRGPQGTLYGASSMGGVIKVVTNQPQLNKIEGSVYGEVSGVYGGGVGFTTTGILNVPLVEDVAALRIGFQEGFVPGYIDQVSQTTGQVLKHNVNTEHDSVFRASVLLRPNDRLSITPSIFLQRVVTGDNDNSYIGFDKNTTGEAIHQPGTDELAIPSLTVAYDAGFADLTSITSYFYRNFPRIQDYTYEDVTLYLVPSVIDPAASKAVAGLSSPGVYKDAVRQVSEEIRIVSKPYEEGGFPVTWLGGVYYAQEKTLRSSSFPVTGLHAALAAIGESPDDPNVVAGSYPGAFYNDNTYFANRHYNTTQYSVFGDLTYNFGPHLRATAGLRYLIAKDSTDLTTAGLYFNAGASQTNAQSRSFALTPKFDIDWDVTDEQTAYINIAKGFRLGGPNRPVPPNLPGVAAGLAALGVTAAPLAYGPDKLWNYEVGLKSRFLDNRVSLNTALFYIDWTDIQQDFIVGQSGFDFQANAGSAESYGGEAELRAKITPELTLTASGSYTHVTFTTTDASLGIQKGDLVQGVPRWNALAGAEYRHAIGDDQAVFALFTARLVGNSRGALARSDPDYKRPGYNIVDATVGYDWKSWEFALFAKNLSDSDKIIQRTNTLGFSGATRLRPVTIGLSALTTF